MRHRPATIENRWDILYRDFPEVYEEFAAVPKNPKPFDIWSRRFKLQGKVVADIGGGTGKSTLNLAAIAKEVCYIEPELAMAKIAITEFQNRRILNIIFNTCGDCYNTRLPDEYCDAVTAVTAPFDPEEAMRILRPGGIAIYVDTAPGWYGGELCQVINHATEAYEKEMIMKLAGFEYFDIDTWQEYGSTHKIVSTYGFIFGQNAIDYLRTTGKTCIQWRIRVYHRQK